MKPSAVLDAWGVDLSNTPILSKDEPKLSRFSFQTASDWIECIGNFGSNCFVYLDEKNVIGTHKLKLRQIGRSTVVDNINVCLLKDNPHLILNIGGSNLNIFLGRQGYMFKAVVNIWGESNLILGDDATCNGARLILQNSDIIIGTDCMISDDVVIQSNDQHGIVDLLTGQIINQGHKRTLIGRHVWLGRRATIMPNCHIGPGSIIGAGSVARGQIEDRVICAGVPARVIRQNASWSRSPDLIGGDELMF